MDRSTAAITGANRGIGLQVATRLASRGHRIVLLCRNLDAGRSALDQLDGSAGPHILVPLDLGSWDSVRVAANVVADLGEPLSALINNAAVLPRTLQHNDQGIELQLAVNHLGHVLLTDLLLPLLKAKDSERPGRVVTVSSGSHYGPPVDLQDTGWARRRYKRLAAYQQSKLANVAFTLALARRLVGDGVEATALHPGVYGTGLLADYAGLGRLIGLLVPGPERAAPVVSRLVDPSEVGAPQGSVNGVYFKKSQEAQPAQAALDVDHQEALWRWSRGVVGLEAWPDVRPPSGERASPA